MENTLAHHGREGQRWGVKNGPPYPLTKEARERVIKEGNLKAIKENFASFDEREIAEAIRRFDMSKKLSEMTSEDVNRGKKTTNDSMERWRNLSYKASTIATALGNVSNLVENISRIRRAAGKTNQNQQGQQQNQQTREHESQGNKPNERSPMEIARRNREGLRENRLQSNLRRDRESYAYSDWSQAATRNANYIDSLKKMYGKDWQRYYVDPMRFSSYGGKKN